MYYIILVKYKHVNIPQSQCTSKNISEMDEQSISNKLWDEYMLKTNYVNLHNLRSYWSVFEVFRSKFHIENVKKFKISSNLFLEVKEVSLWTHFALPL